jgi:hypothetical protein
VFVDVHILFHFNSHMQCLPGGLFYRWNRGSVKPRFRIHGVIHPLPYIPSLRGASFNWWTTLRLSFDQLVTFYIFSCILTVLFYIRGRQVYLPCRRQWTISTTHTHTQTHTPVCNSRLIIALIPGLPPPFFSTEGRKTLSIQNVNKGNKHLPLP